MSKFTSFEFGGSKATLRMFVMFLCLAMSLPGWAQREFMDSSNGLYYQLDDEKQTAELIQKMSNLGTNPGSVYTAQKYVIPASLQVDGKNYKVVKLGIGCFSRCDNLESVTLPSTVEEIGGGAFSSARNLQDVYLNEGLRKIGESCFERCIGVQRIEVPSTVREIGKYAFCGMNINALTIVMKSSAPIALAGELSEHPEFYASAKLIVPSGSENAYQRDATWGKFFMTDYLDAATGFKYRLNALTKTAILVRNLDANGNTLYMGSDYVIPATVKDEKGEEYEVKELGASCFAGYGVVSNDNLNSIVLPNTIRKVGLSCFSNCRSLKSVQLPGSLECLSDSCFSACSVLENIEIPENVSAIGDGCFAGSLLQSIKLPANLQILGKGCFQYCYKLEQADLTSQITVLPIYTFYCCSSLQKVILPASLQKIEVASFADCASLKEITIPENVKEMAQIFWNTNLRTLTCLAKTPPSIPDGYLFRGKQSFANCKLVVPEGSEDAYKKAFVWESFFRVYQTDADNGLLYELDTNTQTAMLLRSDANNLVNCVVSETRVHDGMEYPVTELEADCFSSCRELESVSLPSGIEKLPDYTFSGCYNLRQVQLPAQLKKMGNFCFQSTGIEEITLPQSLEEIGGSCFSFSMLKSITIPASVNTIGDYAFSCFNLKSIKCEGTEPVVANNLLVDDYRYTVVSLYVPTGSVDRYKASEEWGKFSNIEEYVPTSIVGVRSHAASTTAPVYTIDGRKVAAGVKSLPKGIYVSGGKKMVVK